MNKRSNKYIILKKQKKFWHKCIDLAITKTERDCDLMKLWRASQTNSPKWDKIKEFINEEHI